MAMALAGFLLPLFKTSVAVASDAIVIDHTSTDITQIPQSAIEAAKSTLHIAYGHLSHGKQVTRGMTGLVTFANGGGKGLALPDNIFAWNVGGTGGALDLDDPYYPGGNTTLAITPSQLYPEWPQVTRDYLDSHPNVNVFMWAWSYDVADALPTVQTSYLDAMSQLETDYPNVKFVYMTGTLGYDHNDSHYTPQNDTNTKAVNQLIRDYVINNGKILYDFADIESWDPDGTFYEFADDACNYYDSANDTTPNGNWAVEWQVTHLKGPPGGEWYDQDIGSGPHTQPLNANLKAYAAWWLFARLAGWTPDLQPPVVTVNSPDGDEKLKKGYQYDITWSATDDLGVTSVNITYSTDNGTSFTAIAGNETNDGTYAWNIPDTISETSLVRILATDAAGNWGQDESDATFQICDNIPGDANDDFTVDFNDITTTELIILEILGSVPDADANGDSVVNSLDITTIERIILNP